jgi:hypothetical protein
MNKVLASSLLAMWVWSGTASGVIVAGTSGTGNNNDTEAGLVSYLSGQSLPVFPYWDHLIPASNASGIYLGENATTGNGWVLTADHIGPDAVSVEIQGQTYSVTGTIQIGASDLLLHEISGAPMPALPPIPLASSAALVGETALMFGRGFTNANSAPYPWVAPGTNPANGMRWGSNTVEGVAVVDIGSATAPNLQTYIYTDFDGPGDPGVTAFDAQGAVGDSGGGIFVLRGGVWELSGIAHFVDDAPDFNEVIATGDGVVNPSEHGDFTAYADVFAGRAQIDSETGVLIPEPSVVLLGLAGLAGLVRRSRPRSPGPR